MTTFFISFLIGADIAHRRLALLFGTTVSGYFFSWVVPILIVFTSLLVIIMIARYANRKLQSKKEGVN
jgi:hypothetical protein